MEKIVTLLQERNKFLTKFSALNTAEIQKLVNGDFQSIDAFYSTREGILDIIKHVEVMIEKRLQYLGDFSTVSLSVKKLVSNLLKERDQLVNQILAQDLEILECIDQAKNEIIRELHSVRKNRKVIGSYKSGPRDGVVDEEA